MSFSADDIDRFSDEQYKIIETANNTVIENSLAWHREHCVRPEDTECEAKFMKAMFMLLDIKAQRAMGIMVMEIEVDEDNIAVDPTLN